ncbi:acetyltransferase, GNAT family [Synechococcus sp. PCC 7335]|uniref:GNAT family N-acetyltransferase n=1 Tax=Synechococcus sp. (strain ATCC 29403 / PCC 7335) TaxID=91464 RepID=UPI00017EB41B|nr:GNAT family N-acetyltransferase [Synechococcus sp. PCC 7335]EDX85004.1 acetyltransferase, GNAT family [Synechococcus sp. PCC 7335]
MKANFLVSPLEVDDEPVLWEMLMHAAHESSVEAVKANPDLAQYVLEWGRAGDLGVIAKQDKAAVGAAWVRLWSAENQGYGYVSDDIPELAIAVVPRMRGQGIGTVLLSKILQLARPHFPAVCLSIRQDNPALRLYERTGFVKFAGSEVTNRAGGVSFTMLYRF